MRMDYTHITVILDRTGSMEPIRADTIGGFNSFLEGQQRENGNATLSLVQFDSVNPFEVVHAFRPVKLIPALNMDTFVPRGSTPLLDALGHGIEHLDRSLEEIPAAEHPGKVVFVVVTDGQENASTRYDLRRVRQMINEHTRRGWQFVYLSADESAFEDAGALGFEKRSTKRFEHSPEGSRDAWECLAMSVSEYRSGNSDAVTLEPEHSGSRSA